MGCSIVMSQFNAPTYDIQRPTGQCAMTGRTLATGESYFATLVELTDEEREALRRSDPKLSGFGFKRIDISREAWAEGRQPDNLFCYWKTVVPEPNQKKKLFVDDTVLMSLLIRLADADEPIRIAFRHVLGLILMRKKLVRYDGTVTRKAVVNGEPVEQAWWQFTPKLDLSKGPLGKWNEAERIEVLDPKLDAAQIEQVSQQLGEILEGEL